MKSPPRMLAAPRAVKPRATKLPAASSAADSRDSLMSAGSGRRPSIVKPLWRNRITSPSCTMYSFPSRRTCARSRATGRLPAASKSVPAHHFGANEAALDVRVNRAGGFLRVHAALDRPGAHFRFARGEKGSQAQQLISGLNQAVEPRRFESVGREHFGGLGGFEFGEFGLDAPANRKHDGVWAARRVFQACGARRRCPVRRLRCRRDSKRKAWAAAKEICSR